MADTPLLGGRMTASAMSIANDSAAVLASDFLASLQSITAGFEASLDQRLSRLDETIRSYEEGLLRQAADRVRHEELEIESKRWQAERTAQIQQLQHEAEQLRQAWARLESEQRRLLGERANAHVMASGHECSSLASRLGGSGQSPSSNPLANRSSEHLDLPSRQDVIDQFQKLGREMRRHGRRNS